MTGVQEYFFQTGVQEYFFQTGVQEYFCNMVLLLYSLWVS